MKKDYHDIPGTYVFDIEQAQKGYALNKFCETLNRAEGREQFLNNEAAYLDTFDMSEAQKDAIKKRDINKLLELGGNIYYVFKIAAVLGHSMQSAGGMQAVPRMSEAEFRQMMIDGGRPIEGNRSKKENENG
ncbi:protocatechuate 4,5-dioxygenase subunit alpha [Sulfurospirillum sp. 1612]|uniref:protocatechuate 4,5-dioxygenase subunit alpha n=1 Tax=Sulfurospirillum sp. 1612 TaxID=3094835 RepID=UPI002F9279FB